MVRPYLAREELIEEAEERGVAPKLEGDPIHHHAEGLSHSQSQLIA
jgi:hypothetical protein